MIRVLLVDDQELVRAGFRIILKSEPGIEVVGEATSGSDAIRLARELNPDVICMDIQMPGMDGLEATRELVSDPTVISRVLILTTFDRDDYLFSALSAGASGFLLKTASPENLVDAVQVIARGDALLSPKVTARVIAEFGSRQAAVLSPSKHRPAEGAHPAEEPRPAGTPDHGLTDREYEVLSLVAQGWSNAEIASALFVGEATVKTHVSKVLMKLGVRDRVQAVVYAYENGLVRTGK
ncbi:response regulator transcription factor [Diaminobutyricimonas sp. LJ205]|uniref:response regulator n=1 Tax=Diaminobutyricimonas sp. LJ205 TaxID=2683590 RepID=UPI0012F48B1D|nr:response regulator transcription factor [Diaminobutyricimonas sp. LJ205]